MLRADHRITFQSAGTRLSRNPKVRYALAGVLDPFPEPERALCGDWLRERLHIFEHPSPATGRVIAERALLLGVQFRVVLKYTSQATARFHWQAVQQVACSHYATKR